MAHRYNLSQISLETSILERAPSEEALIRFSIHYFKAKGKIHIRHKSFK